MISKYAYFFHFLILFSSCVENYNGEKIYQTQCANCHGKDGEGLKNLIPPVAGSDFVQNNNRSLPCIIRNGLHDTIYVNGIMYFQKMPGNETLSALDIANLVNYINKKWYKNQPFVSHEEVKQLLEGCEE